MSAAAVLVIVLLVLAILASPPVRPWAGLRDSSTAAALWAAVLVVMVLWLFGVI